MAQQVECREKINMNYARIGSIEEEMHLLREQMMNCWREGPVWGRLDPVWGSLNPICTTINLLCTTMNLLWFKRSLPCVRT